MIDNNQTRTERNCGRYTLTTICPLIIALLLLSNTFNITLFLTADAKVVPNDRYWSVTWQGGTPRPPEWGHQQIEVDEAWDLALDPDGATPMINVGSEDIILAIISTGVNYIEDDINVWKNTDEYRNIIDPDDPSTWTLVDYGDIGVPGFIGDDDQDGFADFQDPHILNADWNGNGQTVGEGDLADLDMAVYDNDENGYLGDLYGWDLVEDPNGRGDPDLGDTGYILDEHKTIPHCEFVANPVDEYTTIPYATRIATIASATIENDDQTFASRGYAGMSPAMIMSIRVIPDDDYLLDSAGEERCVKAMNYAINNGADVIILDVYSYNNFLDDEIGLADSRDIVTVAPTGDLRFDPADDSFKYRPGRGGIYYPASHEMVLGVGSTEWKGTNEEPSVSRFSMYGNGIDVVAPGGYGIDNTHSVPWMYNLQTLGVATPTFIYFGTSDSAAFVAGQCALIASYKPSMTAGEIRELVKATTIDLKEEPGDPWGLVGYDTHSGYGEINAYSALSLANYYRNEWPSDKLIRNSQNFADGPQYKPAISLDREGNVHMVWMERGANNNKETFYCAVYPSGTIRNPIRSVENVACQQTESSYPSINVDNNGFVHIAWIETIGPLQDVYYMRMNNQGIVLQGPESFFGWGPSIYRDLNMMSTSTPDFTLVPIGPAPVLMYSRFVLDYDIYLSFWSQGAWSHQLYLQEPGDQIKPSAKLSWCLNYNCDIISFVYQTNQLNPNNWDIVWKQDKFLNPLEEIHHEMLASGNEQQINPDIDVSYEFDDSPFCHITWLSYIPSGLARIEYVKMDTCPLNHNNIGRCHYGANQVSLNPITVSTIFTAVANIETRLFPQISASCVGQLSDQIQVDITWSGPDNGDWYIYLVELSKDGRGLIKNKMKEVAGTGYYPTIDNAKLLPDPNYLNFYDVDGNFCLLYFEQYFGQIQNLFYTTTRNIFSYSNIDFQPSLVKKNPDIFVDYDGGLHVAFESWEYFGGFGHNTIRYAYWSGLSRPPNAPDWETRLSTADHNCYSPKVVAFKDPELKELCAVTIFLDEDVIGFSNGELIMVKVNTQNHQVLVDGPLGYTAINSDRENNHVIHYDQTNGNIAVVYQIAVSGYGQDIRLGLVDYKNNYVFGPWEPIIGSTSNDINPDFDMDESGNIFIVFERNGQIYYNEGIYVPASKTYEISYVSNIRLNQMEVYQYTFPRIRIDQTIHRVFGNNHLSESPGCTWTYIHVVYCAKNPSDPDSLWTITYQKIRFVNPLHPILDSDDVILTWRPLFTSYNYLQMDAEIDPDTLRIVLDGNNQVCLSYIICSSSFCQAFFMKIDNNGVTLSCGEPIQYVYQALALDMEYNPAGQIEIVIDIQTLNPPPIENLIFSRALDVAP